MTDTSKTITATIHHQDATHISDGGGVVIVIITIVIALSIYFLPWIVAKSRGHGSSLGIFFLNLFLGWTFIGWVIALAWAGSKK
jgi:hypothetical protein